MREFLRLTAEAVVVGVLASVALLVAALFIAQAAQASIPAAPASGTLLLRSDGSSIPAPLVATDVQVEIVGSIARTRVTQRFVNPSGDWREGVYVFPLPDSAAVDHLDMRIGTRVIEGQIRERAAARRDYDKAKREGRKAALVEQERANLFTTSVAPIGPGEEVSVAIEYQETLRYDAGSFSLRFPMAITPRYFPGTPAAAASSFAPATIVSDNVPDAASINPPLLNPAQGKGLPVTLSIRIAAGFPLSRIESRFHAVNVEEGTDTRYTVTLADGPVPADRDFELVFTPEIGAAPGAAVFAETRPEAAYALVMLLPNLSEPNAARMAREVTFVIDTSGSMAGTSIVQAKSALQLALGRLQSGDRFNVIEFNSRARPLFALPMPVDPATLGRALSFVAGLRADGGTEMREALELALAPAAAGPTLRQVVFLTDGAVGNEDALFALIRDRLGDRRLFTVGIGSAPNSYFMTRAARFGRGTFTYIGDTSEVEARMAALFVKLESPVLTDIVIDWPEGTQAWPRELPDLYAGEPIVATAALPALSGAVTMRGLRNGRAWRAELPLGLAGDASGVGVLWARTKIDALHDVQVAGANADDIRTEIVRIALAHHLVSKHTSLVAVDVTPSAPVEALVMRSPVHGNVPAGQEVESLVGGLPQTATPARRDMLIALLAILLAGVLLGYARAARGTGQRMRIAQ